MPFTWAVLPGPQFNSHVIETDVGDAVTAELSSNIVAEVGIIKGAAGPSPFVNYLSGGNGGAKIESFVGKLVIRYVANDVETYPFLTQAELLYPPHLPPCLIAFTTSYNRQNVPTVPSGYLFSQVSTDLLQSRVGLKSGFL